MLNFVPQTGSYILNATVRILPLNLKSSKLCHPIAINQMLPNHQINSTMLLLLSVVLDFSKNIAYL